MLIFLAFEVHAAKRENFPIVPPEEAADCEIDKICHDDQGPERFVPDLGWRDSHKPFLSVVATVLCIEYRKKDNAAEGSEREEYIATHDSEPHENGSIHAGITDEFLLSCIP